MERRFWINEISRAFAARSVVWLSGVRRAGKTTLARSFPGATYFDCELVRVRRALEDPELFWRDQRGVTVLDEVHRLANPSEVLKIAADHFPNCKVIATGSSTLAARNKFRDALTGRKREVWLVPMISADLTDFRSTDLDHRMMHGGLPPFFLAPRLDDKDFEEWLTSYWAKDLSELFVVEKRAAFNRFVELVFAQSGGQFEAQSFAGPCERAGITFIGPSADLLELLGDKTAARRLAQEVFAKIDGIAKPDAILETTLLATVVRPYFGGGATEIKSQPKVYAFDTGFVAYFKEWDSLRDPDRGLLLEHLVLGELCARFDLRRIHYWRDKQHHEIDFVLESGRRREPIAIECKTSPTGFSPEGLAAFRRAYPRGRNLVVTLRQAEAYTRHHGDLEVRYMPFDQLAPILDELR